MAVTASAMTHDRQKIMAAGFDAYQSKPISVRPFLEVVRESWTARRRLVVSRQGRILVVDDTPVNLKLLADLLTAKGYSVTTAASGAEALEKIDGAAPDIVLLDVMMPGMSGYDVCRKIRENPATAMLPVVMVTALDPAQERVKGIDAGADDFLTKPINQPELLARVRSLLRVKQLWDQLGELNRTLEAARDRAGRPARAAGPAQALLLAAARRGDRHRRRRGSPEEPSPRDHRGVPRPARLHRLRRDGGARGGHGRAPRVPRGDGRADPGARGHAGAVHRRRHDDLLQRPHPGAEPPGARGAHGAGHARAGRRADARWRKLGYELDFGVGIAQGYATIGAIGFEGRLDYGAIGTVTNLAARLCGEAQPGQILVSRRLHGVVEDFVTAEPAGELSLKGFSRPVTAYNITGLKPA